MSNVAAAAPNLTRPTKMFLAFSIAVMVGYAAAVALVPKKDRKGFSFGIVVTGLIVSIIAVMYNGVLLGKQMGAAQYLAAMRNKMGAAAVAKVGGPITNVGTGAVASA
jgi:hypothetical protein